MKDITVRISGRFKEDIDAVAGQLDTSVKSVVDMIIEWFFETDWGNPDVIARLMADDEEEDDDDEDEDVEGPDLLGELLGLGDDEEEDDDEEE
ncbi:hypothetical protein ES708_32283 [subsurface metagenome]